MRLERTAIAALSLLLALAPAPTLAASADWDGLDGGTRSLLAPWHDVWSTLPATDRQRLLANAARWQAMDKAQREALQQRQAQWDALPPSERARLRARYADWQQLPPDQQARVRDAAARFAALPTPQQGALRAKFAAQPVEWQLAWLLGPSVGSWLDRASDWFAFVPEGEREATLRMLQALPEDARTQLFELGRRLPALQRERLRKDLLLTPPGQRAALIAQRLAQ